jgi:hypothetical protein
VLDQPHFCSAPLAYPLAAFGTRAFVGKATYT